MPFREVTMIEIKEALRLWLAKVPLAEIARQLGLDRKTVRRYTRIAGTHGLTTEAGLTDEFLLGLMVALRTPVEHPHGDAWALCQEQRDFIRSCLDQHVRLTKARKLLARRGAVVPYMTLYRFAVAELGFGRNAATIPVADCEPGEEVQLDTGWVLWLEPDVFSKRRRVRAWIFTAVRSRHRFVWPSFRETTESAIEACEEAWAYFGGVFRVLIPDNTKAIVQTADVLAPRLNHAFLEYAQSRGFHVDTTRVRSPQDKGRVERAVQTVRDDCFGGEHLQDIEQARVHARQWCLQDYGMRRHTRTGRMPAEHFQAEERPVLLSPPADRYDTPIWCDPTVGRDQHAQVAKALYSLPTRFVGEVLRARADRSVVRFYKGDTLIKTHPRQPAGARSTDVTDFPPDKAAYANRDMQYLRRRAAEYGEAVRRFADALLEGPLPWTRMRRVYALFGLARRFGDVRLNEACSTALDAEMIDVKRLKRMLEFGLPRPPTPPASNVVPLARFLRPSSQYALPLTTTPAKETCNE